MEKESFEDEEVSNILNRHFVSIKVDREERPDVDHIYMTFCQALTGQGGWPLTIIMTPDQKPFFAGTYYPKHGRMRMPGLMDILSRVAEAWNDHRDTLIESSEEIAENISRHFMEDEPGEKLGRKVIEDTFNWLDGGFEKKYGGFSQAPKFPTPHNLSFLLRYYKISGNRSALEMVEKTLEGMYKGGIFDHIGWGFSRYSTDKHWLVPHFEKMLYDNALLAIAYTEAYQVTRKNIYAEVAVKIFTYVLRDMTSPDGGFYSAEDADSEGEEGKYYVWTPKEIEDILGTADAKNFCEYYNITEVGNFEGKNIPNRIHANEQTADAGDYMNLLREKVFQQREKRIHPYKDDKILTAWNGLMIAALAIGGRVLGKELYIDAAKKAADFIYGNLMREDGRLLARYRDGDAAYLAYVDDYAFLVWGLIELYQATYEPLYLERAIALNEGMLKLFWDEDNGGLFMYGADSEKLIARPKEIYDGAQPSGNSVAALNLLRLARLTGDNRLEQIAAKQIDAFGATVKDTPGAYTYFMTAVMSALYPSQEVVITGAIEDRATQDMLEILRREFLPNTVSILRVEGNEGNRLLKLAPYIQDQTAIDNRTAAYVCKEYTCSSPVTDVKAFENMLLQ